MDTRLNLPDMGKENIMIRFLFVVLMVGLFSAAITGCRAEGEIGDTSSSIAAPR